MDDITPYLSATHDVVTPATKGPTGMCSCDPKFGWDRHACAMGKLTRNPESFCTCRCHTPPWRTEPATVSARPDACLEEALRSIIAEGTSKFGNVHQQYGPSECLAFIDLTIQICKTALTDAGVLTEETDAR